MMKKMLSVFALALLTVVGLEAHKELKGLSGAALVDLSNIGRLTAGSALPASLSGANFSVSPITGCGFTIQPICLTIRSDSAFAASALVPNPFAVPNNPVEIVAQFRVTFDQPFKNRPAVTTTLEIQSPNGAGCPLVNGGSQIGTAAAPVGYINDNFIFLTNVTTTGFTVNFDAKLALNGAADPVTVVQGLIALGISFDFVAVATK